VLPSFIRPNFAALVAVALLILFAIVFRSGRWFLLPVAALLVAAFFAIGLRPGDRVDFEDAHVIHRGGELFPNEYAVARFLYQGGWIVHAGDSLSFLARGVPSLLVYRSPGGATISIGGRMYTLPPSPQYTNLTVELPRDGRTELRCLAGSANLDRMQHE